MNSRTTERWDDVGAIDLSELFARLWAGRMWIGAGVVVCTLIAAAIAFLAVPVYRATTVLISASSERAGLSSALNTTLGQLGGLAQLAGVNLAPDDATEESLAVLRSRHFTEGFIRDHNLMAELFAEDWDAANGKWKVPTDKQPTLARAYKYFDEKVRRVTRDKKTGLVSLSIDWTDRTKAAQWANELVNRLNAEMRARAIRESDASVGFLQKELAATTVVETRAAISRLIEAQVNRRMLANVSKEYAFRIVDPALPSDPGEFIWPQRPLLLIGGALLGAALGSIFAYLFTGRTNKQ